MTTSFASWRDGLVPLPSLENIRSKLKYFPETGSLTWIGRRNGKEAGCKQYRYDGSPNAIRVGVELNGRLYQYVAHRLIFFLMGIEVPFGMIIDHVDDNPFNNQWKNLRLATHSQNICNQRPQVGNPLPKGVIKTPAGTFSGVIRKQGKSIYTQTFRSPSEAKAARDILAKLHHGAFARA